MRSECAAETCERQAEAKGLCLPHYKRLKRKGTLDLDIPIADKRRGRAPRPTSAMTPDMIARFERSYIKSAGCWTWLGPKASHGYGGITFDGKRRMAHRVALERVIGDIDAATQVDHICGNRLCVNPAHLRVATQKQNSENLTVLRSDNTSGYRGVTWHGHKKAWHARVQHLGRQVSCGYHRTPEAAAEAARRKRLELFTHNSHDFGSLTILT